MIPTADLDGAVTMLDQLVDLLRQCHAGGVGVTAEQMALALLADDDERPRVENRAAAGAVAAEVGGFVNTWLLLGLAAGVYLLNIFVLRGVGDCSHRLKHLENRLDRLMRHEPR